MPSPPCLCRMEKVDIFLYDILYRNYCDASDTQSASAAAFLEKSEETISSFIQSDERSELEFPPLNSFYRRIIHCLGRRYGLVHRVEPTNLFNSTSTLRKIYLTKPVGTDGDSVSPILKSSDWIAGRERPRGGLIETSKKQSKPTKKSSKSPKPPAADESNKKPKFKILKRESSTTPTAVSPVTAPQLPPLEILSLEEREAKYQAARDRIFEGFKEDAVIEEIHNNFPVVPSNSTDIAEGSSNNNNNTDCTDSVSDSDYGNGNVSKIEVDPTTPTNSTNTGLNPEAAPFSFDLITAEEPVIDIIHIYTITPVVSLAQLSQDHFKAILAAHPTATIKTRSVPTDFAFLLLSDPSDHVPVNGDHYQVTKWTPEFYVD